MLLNTDELKTMLRGIYEQALEVEHKALEDGDAELAGVALQQQHKAMKLMKQSGVWEASWEEPTPLEQRSGSVHR